MEFAEWIGWALGALAMSAGALFGVLSSVKSTRLDRLAERHLLRDLAAAERAVRERTVREPGLVDYLTDEDRAWLTAHGWDGKPPTA